MNNQHQNNKHYHPNYSKTKNTRSPVHKLKSCLIKHNRQKNANRKRVHFHPKVIVNTYPKEEIDEKCILNPMAQTVMHNCEIAHERIVHIINKNSIHNILRPSEIDNPVKVFDVGIDWWNDKSPLILYYKLRDNNDFLQKFLILFDQYIKKNQKVGEIKPLTITNKRFKIRFPRVIRNR